MAYESEKAYLGMIPVNPISSLPSADLDKLFFQAEESLSIYHSRHITARIKVLQAIYNYESSSNQYESLKRQGIQSYSTKRGSIAFGSGGDYSSISPQVKEIIGEPPADIGRFRSC